VSFRIRRGSEAFEIDPAAGSAAAIPFDSVAAAESFLRGFLRDEWNARALRALFRQAFPETSPARFSDADIVRRLAPLLLRDRLRVRRPLEEEAEPILPAGMESPIERSPEPPKETVQEKTWIEFELLDEDGAPMAGESYELCLPDGSVRKGKLDTQGLVRVAGIDPGLGTISWFLKPSKAKKGGGVAGYGKSPMPAPPVWPPTGLPPVPPKLAAIRVTVPRTMGKRDKTKSRGSDANWIAASSDSSMTANPPKVIVCGTKDLLLEAVTVPLNQQVTWKVDPNPAVGTVPPSLVSQEGGRKAILKTDKRGSFSVTATLYGTKVVWNVVFVQVKVDPDSTIAHHRNDGYKDGGSNSDRLRFRSGRFKKNEYAWDASVEVQVIGGGISGDLGVAKVKLHDLQNGVACDLKGVYGEKDGVPGTALEEPKGGFPVLDSTDESSPFGESDSSSVQPNNSDKKRTVWTGDSPTGSFPKSHAHTGKELEKITGGNTFRTAVAATSDDAPGSIVVLAQVYWIAKFSGAVDNFDFTGGGVGKYVAIGARTEGQKKYELISPASGGMDAGDANFESCEPRYNNGVNIHWSP